MGVLLQSGVNDIQAIFDPLNVTANLWSWTASHSLQVLFICFKKNKTNKWRKKIKRTQHLWHFNRENEFETVASCCGFFLLRWVTLIHKTHNTHNTQNVFHLHLKISDVLNITAFFAAKRQKADDRFVEWFRLFYFIYEHTHSSKTLQTNAEITCQMDVSHYLNW